MKRAMVIGVGNYAAPYLKLPAVAGDVREIAKLLRSRSGSFSGGDVTTLAGSNATRSRVLAALEHVFCSAGPDDVVFVYMAGHGEVEGTKASYYYVAQDTKAERVATTGVALATLKRLFDECKCHRTFLWLDFCHSGGITARGKSFRRSDERYLIRRELEVVHGHGKMILAACAPNQGAYEDSRLGHGKFTACLLEGLRGAAATAGEVTVASLFDYVDRKMGSPQQRPMMFGAMEGRVVLMHYPVEDVGRAGPKTIVGGRASKTERGFDSSGNWCMLDTDFFSAKTVKQSKDGTITLDIVSNGPETDAAVSRFRPGPYGRGQPVPYAFRNDGMLVRVGDVESVSRGNAHVWTVTIKPEPGQQGNMTDMAFSTGTKSYSPDDLAKLRGKRILLNDPPAREGRRGGFDESSLLESFIGMNSPAQATACAIQKAYARRQKADEVFLRVARLLAIFMLKTRGVCEHVLALRLGPVRDGRCQVKFRGRRRKVYDNMEPSVIEIEGDCPLR